MGYVGFEFFGYFIAYYGLMILIGITIACVVSFYIIKRNKLVWNDFIILLSVSGLFAIIGAKVLYIIINLKNIEIHRLCDLKYWSLLMQGGFVFYGGLIGGIIGAWICKKALKIDVVKYINCCIPCLPMAHGFGRIGCGLVGCCYGKLYTGLGNIVYKHSMFAPNNVKLFPIQFIEAGGEFIITLVLIMDEIKGNKKELPLKYLFMYSVMRFVLEFMRGDSERGFIGVLSTSQIVSVVIFMLCIYKFVYIRKNNYIEKNRCL